MLEQLPQAIKEAKSPESLIGNYGRDALLSKLGKVEPESHVILEAELERVGLSFEQITTCISDPDFLPEDKREGFCMKVSDLLGKLKYECSGSSETERSKLKKVVAREIVDIMKVQFN